MSNEGSAVGDEQEQPRPAPFGEEKEQEQESALCEVHHIKEHAHADFVKVGGLCLMRDGDDGEKHDASGADQELPFFGGEG